MSAGAIRNGGRDVAGSRQRVELTWKQAGDFAWKSVRVRFLRSLITAGGVFLGVAFLASILVSKAIAGTNIEHSEAARLNWLVGLSLAVCVVGITNSMLMSVSERFREIGTMKCLGALDGFVVRIFMIEAVTMGVIAAALGWGVGTGLMVLAKVFTGVAKDAPAGTTWYGSLNTGALLISFAFCLVVGAGLTALATFFPARQAASIPPAAALRTDV